MGFFLLVFFFACYGWFESSFFHKGYYIVVWLLFVSMAGFDLTMFTLCPTLEEFDKCRKGVTLYHRFL